MLLTFPSLYDMQPIQFLMFSWAPLASSSCWRVTAWQWTALSRQPGTPVCRWRGLTPDRWVLGMKGGNRVRVPIDRITSSIPGGILPQNVCCVSHFIIVNLADMAFKCVFLLLFFSFLLVLNWIGKQVYTMHSAILHNHKRALETFHPWELLFDLGKW